MSKVMKWFLGIFAGLVVVAVLGLASFWVFNRWHNAGWMMNGRVFRFVDGRVQSWNKAPGKETPWNARPQSERPMRPMLVRPASWFGSFPPLRILFGCLIVVGIILLVVLGVVYLARPRQPVTTSNLAVPPPLTPVSIQACSHCGRAVQDDWSHCPYCGNVTSGQKGSETTQA